MNRSIGHGDDVDIGLRLLLSSFFHDFKRYTNLHRLTHFFLTRSSMGKRNKEHPTSLLLSVLWPQPNTKHITISTVQTLSKARLCSCEAKWFPETLSSHGGTTEGRETCTAYIIPYIDRIRAALWKDWDELVNMTPFNAQGR